MTNSDLWLKANKNSALLDAVHECNLEDVASMSTLRKLWSIEEISIAASLLDARKRAAEKISNADSILSDSIGVQQATSTEIAKHKSKRFVTDGPVYDLCCGIGADLQELPMQTIGVDNDPLRCTMANFNTGKETICEDVLLMDIPSNALIHIDPSRRSGTKRLHGLDTMKPNIEAILDIASKAAGGCIKVSPAVNLDDLESFSIPLELEYIEEHGRVVQCVIWFGSLAKTSGSVSACSMTLGKSVSGVPEFSTFTNNLIGWILEPNPALERSGLHCTLAKEFGAKELAPNLGLFCAKEECDSDWFQQFEILETTPLRIEKVKRTLAELKCTQVEVKTRGKTIDPNQWQDTLSSKASGELLTVFALRLGKNRTAIITRRLGRR
ncbi:MAG: hypothetical protein ISR75_06830 [Phycisphaerales bacterium]|nr:hypothetical protein [Phycisphaerales bacterium]